MYRYGKIIDKILQMRAYANERLFKIGALELYCSVNECVEYDNYSSKKNITISRFLCIINTEQISSVPLVNFSINMDFGKLLKGKRFAKCICIRGGSPYRDIFIKHASIKEFENNTEILYFTKTAISQAIVELLDSMIVEAKEPEAIYDR